MRKRIFNVLFISVFAAMLGLGIIAPLMPIYAQSLGATGIWLGIIFSGFSLSRAIFTPLFGRLSDRKGRKKFLTFGMLLYSLISLFYPLADNVYCLTIVRLIHGVASAMIVPIAMAYVGELAQEGREGDYMGTFSVALFLGMGFGPFLGGLINDLLGMSAVFYVMVALAAIAFFITLMFLPDSMGEKEVNKQTLPVLKEALGNDVIKGLLLFRFISALGRGGIMAFLPILGSKINISASQIGVLLTVNICLTGFLQRLFGRLADRHNELVLILIGSTIGAFALLIIPVARAFSGLLFISFVMGLGGAISIPSAMKIAVKVGRNVGMGTSMGLFNTAMSGGMVAAPLISGVVMDTLGLMSVFYVAGVISLLGVFAFYYYVRREI